MNLDQCLSTPTECLLRDNEPDIQCIIIYFSHNIPVKFGLLSHFTDKETKKLISKPYAIYFFNRISI